MPEGTDQPIKLKPKMPAPAGGTPPVLKPKAPATATPVAAAAAPPVATPAGAPTVAAPVAAPKPPVLKPKAPAGVSPVTPPVAAPVAAGAEDPKKETSRIPLEAASVLADGDATKEVPTKLISVKPAAAPVAGAPAPAVATPVAAPPQRLSEKQKTSRISLDAAVSSAPPAGGPKTIKLKKPGEAPTIKSVAPPKADKSDLSKTARIDGSALAESDDAEDGSTPTKRKTIRVKRPSQRTGVKGVTVAKKPGAGGGDAGAEASDETDFTAPEIVFSKEDSPNICFHIFASVAIIVMIVTMYMFSAQLFGPNISLTELSYAKTGPNLGWPGKINVYQ